MSLGHENHPLQAILAPASEPDTPDKNKAKVGYLRKKGIAINNKAGTDPNVSGGRARLYLGDSKGQMAFQ